MTIVTSSRSADVRSRLGHPVVDVDGHIMEYMPLVREYFHEEGDDRIVALIENRQSSYATTIDGPSESVPGWYDATEDQRQEWRIMRPPYWAQPTRLSVDAATSRLPRLLRSRMEEIGLDFAVLYPTNGLRLAGIQNAEARQVACRAFNRYLWDAYGPHGDVVTPAAIIPAHTPEEAVRELEFAVRTLGFKAVVLPAQVRRPLSGVAELAPELARHATYLDKLALDSEYDYDPVWQKCVELKVAPTFHSGSQDWDSRRSPSNYMYNHVGHFAASSEALCKALFFGGVTRRFPDLAFGFLEAGVGWAVSLYADLVGHWEKRGRPGMDNYDPQNLDIDLLQRLVSEYGDPRLLAAVAKAGGGDFLDPDREDRSRVDDFAAVGLERAEEIPDRFIPNFFFGCEADDPVNATAFNTKVNPFGARLNAVFSTDIGHWDVPDMRDVLAEAYQLVERGALDEVDFRDFVFTNPVKLHTRLNPAFFDGTPLEAQAKER